MSNANTITDADVHDIAARIIGELNDEFAHHDDIGTVHIAQIIETGAKNALASLFVSREDIASNNQLMPLLTCQYEGSVLAKIAELWSTLSTLPANVRTKQRPMNANETCVSFFKEIVHIATKSAENSSSEHDAVKDTMSQLKTISLERFGIFDDDFQASICKCVKLIIRDLMNK